MVRKLVVSIVAVGVLLAVASVAVAASASASLFGHHSPAQSCKTELHTLGATTFEHTYGSDHNLHHAMGNCVSHMAHQKHHN